MPPPKPSVAPQSSAPKASAKQEELLDAIKQGDETAVSAIIALGVAPTFFTSATTPLITAVENNASHLLKVLAEAGADVNAACGNGNTPLRAAIMAGDADSIVGLLKLGADVNLATQRGTPLIAAATLGDCDILTTLLDEGADIHYEAKDGSTALIAAVRENKKEVSIAVT